MRAGERKTKMLHIHTKWLEISVLMIRVSAAAADRWRQVVIKCLNNKLSV